MTKPTVALMIGLTILLCAAASVRAAPPAVDPTYGLPLPKPAPPARFASSWIWASTTTDNQTVLFRRELNVPAVPRTATLFITADDFFTLWVDGKQVDASQPDPNDGSVWEHVHRVDITPYLTPGRNIIAVQALNVGGQAGLVAELDAVGLPKVFTDAAWKVSTAPPLSGWNDVDFDDAAWPYATIIAPIGQGVWSSSLIGWGGADNTVPYLAHLALPVAGIIQVHPGGGKLEGVDKLPGNLHGIVVATPPPAGGDAISFVLDFGKEVAGRVRVLSDTPGIVQVGTGESLEEAVHSPWQGVHILNVDGQSPAFTPYSAFRYAQVVIPASAASRPMRLGFQLDDKYYPVRYKGRFDCSDPLITKIWYTGAYTAHLCMQEDIWDAPKRDRARWVGDLDVSGEVINDVFADRFLMEQTLKGLRLDSQGGNADNLTLTGNVNGIPGYSCAWICCLADFYRHIGDDAYLRAQHDYLIALMEYLRGELDAQGVFANKHGSWSYVDWSPGFDGAMTPDSIAATHLFMTRAIGEGAFLLRQLGDTANADKYAAFSKQLAATARQTFPDATTNTYGKRLETNAMAIYSGVATPAQEEAIAATVLNPDSDSWDKTGTPPYNPGVISPYYGNYVLYALSKSHHTSDGLRLLRSYWGGMIAEGATTFWEAYDPFWPKSPFHSNLYSDGSHGTYVSLSHGWSSGPTAWLMDQVLGVQPTSGGFKTVDIVPDLGDLQWATGDIPTPSGNIHIELRRSPDGMDIRLTIPKDVDAHVTLPGRILVNGKEPPIVSSENARNTIDLPNSGAYRIASTGTASSPQ